MPIEYSKYGTLARKLAQYSAGTGSISTINRPRNEVTCQNPCNSAFITCILHGERLIQRLISLHALNGVICLLHFFYQVFFHCNNYTFSANHQPEPWWLWQHFETSWAPILANCGVLERPRPLGLKRPGRSMSVGCLDFRDDHLVSSMS